MRPRLLMREGFSGFGAWGIGMLGFNDSGAAGLLLRNLN